MSDAAPGRRSFARSKRDPRRPSATPGQRTRIITTPGAPDPVSARPSGPPQPTLRYATTFKPKADRNKNKSGGVA
jgi:hypothetical protein